MSSAGKSNCRYTNVTGARRFTALVGLVLIVHAAFATLLASAPRYEGQGQKTLGQTRLSTIAQALRRAPQQTEAAAPL